MFVGDVYSAEELPEVPVSLETAMKFFCASEFAKRALGDSVYRHYVRFFEFGIEAFQAAVTDSERHRYFERI